MLEGQHAQHIDQVVSEYGTSGMEADDFSSSRLDHGLDLMTTKVCGQYTPVRSQTQPRSGRNESSTQCNSGPASVLFTSSMHSGSAYRSQAV